MKPLNLENMISAYKIVCKTESGEEQCRVWDSFSVMCQLGFISTDTWDRFYETCKDL